MKFKYKFIELIIPNIVCPCTVVNFNFVDMPTVDQ